MALKALSRLCLRLLTQHAMRGLSPRRCRCWRSRVGTKSACCGCVAIGRSPAAGRLAAVGADRPHHPAGRGWPGTHIDTRAAEQSSGAALCNAFALASCSARHVHVNLFERGCTAACTTRTAHIGLHLLQRMRLQSELRHQRHLQLRRCRIELWHRLQGLDSCAAPCLLRHRRSRPRCHCPQTPP